MNPAQVWGQSVVTSFSDLGTIAINLIVPLIGALLIFFAGLIIASVVGKAIEKAFSLFKVDQVVERTKLAERIKSSGMKVSISKFIGAIIKWFLVLVFLMAATEVLQLNQFTIFLRRVIEYIPNIVVATIILAIAFLLSNLAFHAVRSSTKAAGIISATLLANISKWAILIFALSAALNQLRIAETIINSFVMGIIAALALALGLAFGLGGKEEAAVILKKLREEISERNHD